MMSAALASKLAPWVPMEMIEQEGRDVFPGDVLLTRQAQPFVQRRIVQVGVKFVFWADGIGDNEGGVEIQALTCSHDVGDLTQFGHLPAHRVPGVGEIETGEALRAVPDQADVERLEPFEGGTDVQDRFDTRTHDRDGRVPRAW